MLRSLRWQLALSLMGLVMLTSVLLTLVLAQVSRRVYLNDLDERLRSEAALIGADLSPLLADAPSSAAVQPRVASLAQVAEARITVIGMDGRVLGDSSEDPATLENHASRPEVQQALATGLGTAERFSTSVGYTMHYLALPITAADGTPIGVIRVALPLRDIDSRVAQLSRLSLLVGLGVAIVAGLLVVLLVRGMLRPVEDLTAGVREIAAGNLNRRVAVRGRHEIGDLARAFNDMSQRLAETLRRVQEESATMAAVLATMEDAVCVTNGEGVLLLMNDAAARLFQMSRERAVGRHFLDVALDHEMDTALRACLHVQAAQTVIIQRPDDHRILRLTATPVRRDPKQRPGALVIIQDITELRRLESVRRDFIANISHELRTPIAAIKALVEMLEDGALAEPEVAQDFLSKMHGEIDRLAQMVQELLDLTRIESGESPPVLAAVPVADLVRGVVDRLSPQAERAGLDVRTSLPDGLPPVLADRERIARVLLNLIHNAIKFTPAGGTIRVSAQAGDGVVTFSVSDTGVGISADDLPRVFERFYKVDPARSGRADSVGSSGTGLGLAIAKHTVQSHGGRIWVTSHPGAGATFSFTLPIARTETNGGHRQSAGRAEPAG
jgi:two-component system phosphate regulon sensor histidine kinase PhoR